MANATTNTNISINNKERLKLFEAVCDDMARAEDCSTSCCCVDCVDCKVLFEVCCISRP